MTTLRTVTFTAADLEDLAANFERMAQISADGPKKRPAANRHWDNGSANAYAKAAEMVRKLAEPARPRPALRLVETDEVRA